MIKEELMNDDDQKTITPAVMNVSVKRKRQRRKRGGYSVEPAPTDYEESEEDRRKRGNRNRTYRRQRKKVEVFQRKLMIIITRFAAMPAVHVNRASSLKRSQYHTRTQPKSSLTSAVMPPLELKTLVCEYGCGFERYATESKGICCLGGRLNTLRDHVQSLPDELLHIYNQKWFPEWSRAINGVLRFSSVGYLPKGGLFATKMAGQLRLLGQVYCRMLPADQSGPVKAWTMDLSQQTFDTSSTIQGKHHLKEAKIWLKQVSAILQQINPFARELQSIGFDDNIETTRFQLLPVSKHNMDSGRMSTKELSIVDNENSRREMFAMTLPSIKPASLISDLVKKGVSSDGLNVGGCSFPSVESVSRNEVFITHNQTEKAAFSAITMRKATDDSADHDRHEDFVHVQNPFWDALGFPLFFPTGDAGWGHNANGSANVCDSNGKNITLDKYVRCMLLHESRFALLGHLCQQWILEQFARDESNTLNFIRFHNRRLKKAPRSMVAEAVQQSNVIAQRSMAKVRLTAAGINTYTDIKLPLSDHLKQQVDYDDIIVQQTDVHVDDQDESFTANDMKHLPGYTYLPSASVPGGPRYMALKFADGMTIAAKKNKPTCFTTFTANPKWPEISEKLCNRSHEDNPVIVARVFKAKLAEFLKDLRKGIFFRGRAACYIISVVEFQWRGLPHAHIVYRLTGHPMTSKEIDELFVTCLSSLSNDQDRELVQKFMTHKCRVDTCLNSTGSYQSFYSRPLNPTATTDERGYPQYRRLTEADRRIVPSILPMLQKYHCHINTELCHDVFVIEYLFKYIYKGRPRMKVDVADFVVRSLDRHVPKTIVESVTKKITNEFPRYVNDEIATYQYMRCICATDAAYKFLGFHKFTNEPPVQTLHIETPGNELIHYPPEQLEGMRKALRSAIPELTIYWNRPTSPIFNDLLIEDFFDRFTVTRSVRASNKNFAGSILIPPSEALGLKTNTELFVYLRQQKGELHQTIHRMKFISPTAGERFYLRMHLRHYPSRSFEDCCRVDGILHATCFDACKALGLFSDEDEYEQTLTEAVAELYSPARLRHLFVILALSGMVKTAAMLDMFALEFSMDFYSDAKAEMPKPPNRPKTVNELDWQVRNHLLTTLRTILNENGRNMADLKLPEPTTFLQTELERERHTHTI